jgi:hypothetical protein
MYMKLRASFISALAASALFCAQAARATTVTYGPDSYGPATTNWSTSLSLPKWDPSLFPGDVLTGISFTLDGSVSGNAKFESLDAAPATVTMNLQATIKLFDPNSNVLVIALPIVATSDIASAFDGTIDFGGTSGKSYLGETNSDSETGTSTDYATFTGSGNVSLPVQAKGSSNGSGAGNLILQFNTFAAASASVTYTYSAATPEPASLVSLAIGLVSLGGYRLARRPLR